MKRKAGGHWEGVGKKVDQLSARCPSRRCSHSQTHPAHVLKEYCGFHNVVKHVTGDKGAQFSSVVKV